MSIHLEENDKSGCFTVSVLMGLVNLKALWLFLMVPSVDLDINLMTLSLN